MKKFIKSIFYTLILFTGGIMASSCDPCSGVVCTNGNCSNGICLCEPGFKKLNGKCIPINLDYEGTDWRGIQIFYFNPMPPDTQQVVYTFEASEIKPNQIILKSFLNYLQNDLPLSIDLKKKNIFVEEHVLPVDITNGTLTNPPFLPRLYGVAGSINPNEMDLTLTPFDSIDSYRLILHR